jgi:predicted transcriptional regulator
MGKRTLGLSDQALALLTISLMLLPSLISITTFNGSAQGGTEHLVQLTSPPYSYPFPQIKGTINITGTAYDPHGNADIKNVTFAVGPIYPMDEHRIGPLAVNTFNSYSQWFLVWDSTELLDGDYRITMELTDKQGYSAVTYSNITLNNTGGSPLQDKYIPEVTVRIIQKGILAGKILIEGDGYDPEWGTGPGQYVTKVEIKIDSGPWTWVAINSSWSYWFDTSLLVDGWHDVFARSFDGFRYSVVQKTTFLCDNNPANDPSKILWGGNLDIVDAITWSEPVFKDLDGDRDIDILSTNVWDDLYYYKNIGNVREPLWAASKMVLPADTGNKKLTTVVDLDSSGTQDLVYYDRSTQTLEVYRNLGSPAEPVWTTAEVLIKDPKFGGETRFAFAGGGDPVLYVADWLYGWSFYRNSGNSTVPKFTLENGMTSGLPTPLEYNFFQVEDVDSNGKLELCMARYNGTSEGTLHLFRLSSYDQSPPWTEDKNYFSSIHGNITSFGLPDLDGDGDKDLVLYNNSDKLVLYWNRGTSAVPNWTLDFDPVANIPSPWGRPPVLVDFDGDGDQDLWVPDCSKPYCWNLTYQYYENTGSPTDPKFTFRPNLGAALPKDAGIVYLAFPDLNADGKVELLVFWDKSAGWGGYGDILNASYYLNSGNSSVPKWTKTAFDLGGPPAARKVLFHDMDNDGDLDMILSTNQGGTMWIRNIGSATSFLWEKKTTSYWITTFTPEYIQLDGKGDEELVDWSGTEGGLKVYLNYLNYACVPDDRYFLNHSFGDRIDLALGDIDGDGDKDLVLSDYYSTLKIVKNLGFAFSGPTIAPLGIIATPGQTIRFDAKAMLAPEDLNATSEFFWDFGNGQTTSWSSDPIVYHNFTTAGEHAVVFHARNTTGPILVQTYVIVRSVPKSPIALIDAPSTVNEGETVLLSGARSYDPDGSIVSYEWNLTGFDLKTKATGKEITQVFWSSLRKVTVSLTVKDDSGRSSMTSTTLIVIENPAWDDPVEATVQAPHAGPVGTPVLFNVTVISTSAPGTWGKDYSWNFGDGEITELTQPLVEHTFKKAGKFNISVYVRDSRDHGVYVRLNITIFDPKDSANFPEAIILGPSKGYQDEDVQLKGSTSHARITGLDIVRYRWDLGDGTVSDAPNPTHRYNRSGQFNVTLEVWDELGLQGLATKSVAISNRSSGGGTPPGGKSAFNTSVALGILLVLSISIVMLGLLSTEVGLLKVMPGLFVMYSKIKRVEVLDHYVRGKIMGIVQLNPGQTYTSIKDELDLPNGTLSYHLKVMEQEEFLFSRREGLLKRFYPASNPKEVSPITLEEQILGILRRNPGISQKELAQKTGTELLRIHRALHKLHKGGLVQIVKDGKSTKCFIAKE